MTNLSASKEAKRRAFSHVINAINDAERLPDQVFRGSWNSFLFFQSDYVIASDFVNIVATLLNAERAEVCCIVNFSNTERLAYESAALLFIDASLEAHVYDAMLKEGGPSKGWLYDVGRYGISSDLGGWSIYCERNNDVAVIALRQSDDTEKYMDALRQLYAKPIAELLADPSIAPVPYCMLVDTWRDGLVKHYAKRM